MKAAKASRPTRKVLQDRTNQGEETKEGSVAVKKQKANSGDPMPTQHIDVEPTQRVTRRMSREREKAAAMIKSSTSGDVTVRVEESSEEKNGIKSSTSDKDLQPKLSADSASKASATAGSKAIDQTSKKATGTAKVPSKDTAKSTSKSDATSAETSTSDSPPMPHIPARKLPPNRRKLKRPDPSHCLDIISPMYDLFYQQEQAYLVRPYMDNQKDLNSRMRGILVDWLVEVHYKFRLQPPTLWRCVNLLDRYLEKEPLLRKKLQLLGVTCLFIACKFEEIYPPEVRDCVYITDNAYTRAELLTMERSVLTVLGYQLCVPTGYNFLTRYLNIINANEKTRHLSFYYAERNLQESLYLQFKPSRFVCSALYAALVQENDETYRYDSDDERIPDPWPEILVEETGYDESDLIPLARMMLKHVDEEPITTSMRRLIAAKKKYSHDKYFNVSDLDHPII